MGSSEYISVVCHVFCQNSNLNGMFTSVKVQHYSVMWEDPTELCAGASINRSQSSTFLLSLCHGSVLWALKFTATLIIGKLNIPESTLDKN